MGQGQMLHQAVHRRGLRAVLAHELQPGGGVVKEVPDGDGGALRRAGGLHLTGFSPLQVEGGALRRAGLPGQDVHPADGGDGGQGLAPEAQGADPPQVRLRPQLGGGVAQKGRGQLGRGDAAAVVRHPDHAHAAPADLHRNGGGAGVDGVLHQLLHHAGGPLHDLTGGDQIRHMGLQLLDMGHRFSSFVGRPAMRDTGEPPHPRRTSVLRSKTLGVPGSAWRAKVKSGVPGEAPLRWGPLHDLAGGNQIRHMGLQLLDMGHLELLSPLTAAVRPRWGW